MCPMNEQLHTPTGQSRWNGRCGHCAVAGFLVGDPNDEHGIGCNACGTPDDARWSRTPMTQSDLDELRFTRA